MTNKWEYLSSCYYIYSFWTLINSFIPACLQVCLYNRVESDEMKSYSLKLEKKAAYGITQQFSLGKYFSITHPLGSEVTGKKTFIFYFVAGRLGSPKINHLLLETYFICGHCLERMKGKSGAFIAVSTILAVKGGDSIQLNTVTAHRSM